LLSLSILCGWASGYRPIRPTTTYEQATNKCSSRHADQELSHAVTANLASVTLFPHLTNHSRPQQLFFITLREN
jgi:hypothetical protein